MTADHGVGTGIDHHAGEGALARIGQRLMRSLPQCMKGITKLA
jgi:hypothetical protein